jgi:hypothetical protein
VASEGFARTTIVNGRVDVNGIDASRCVARSLRGRRHIRERFERSWGRSREFYRLYRGASRTGLFWDEANLKPFASISQAWTYTRFSLRCYAAGCALVRFPSALAHRRSFTIHDPNFFRSISSLTRWYRHSVHGMRAASHIFADSQATKGNLVKFSVCPRRFRSFHPA